MKDLTGRIKIRNAAADVCTVCSSMNPHQERGVHDDCRVCMQSGKQVAAFTSQSSDVMEYEGGSSVNDGVDVLNATVKQGMPVHTHVYVKGWFDRMRSGISVFKPVFSVEQVHQATKFRFTNELFPIMSSSLIGVPALMSISLAGMPTMGIGAGFLGFASLVGAAAAPFGLRKIVFGHKDKVKDKFFKESVAVNRKGFAVWLMNRYGISVSDATLETLFPDSRSALNELEVVAEAKFEDVQGKHWKLVRSELDGFYVESLEVRSNEAHSYLASEPMRALDAVEYGLPVECQSSVEGLLQKIAVLTAEGSGVAEVEQVVERARGELAHAVELYDRLSRLGREKDGVQELTEVLALLKKSVDDALNMLATGVVGDFRTQSSFLREIVAPRGSLKLDENNHM